MCVRVFEYLFFVLVNVIEVMLVDFVFVNVFFVYFMNDII